jgi:hypothetical protein
MRFSLGRLTARLIARVRAVSSPRRSRSLQIESLEERCLPTAYTVTTAKDLLNDIAPGQLTLRDVLTALQTGTGSGNALAPSTTNSISFAIGRTASVQTITLSSTLGALPAVTREVQINGLSQGGPGYAGVPLIVLNGTNAGMNADGLDFEPGSDGSMVTGLVIQRFGGNGLVFDGTSGNIVQDDFIGTSATGVASVFHYGNALTGILLQGGATNNTIGGTTHGTGNVISGNGSGVVITGSGTSNNVILGNLIGTDIRGTGKLGNAGSGVFVNGGASGNTIGGTPAGAGNDLSANAGDGIDLEGTLTSGNLVLGNQIGTDIHGVAALGNGFNGIDLDSGASKNTIGGSAVGAGNVISGNARQGIQIGQVLLAGQGPSSGNVVQGNEIGTDITGTIKLRNGMAGVLLDGKASGNVIGGTASGAGNVISGNGGDGVTIGLNPFDPRNNAAGALVSGNTVSGNWIGTDFSGIINLGNGGNGVTVVDDATQNTDGGTAGGSGNRIAFNLTGIAVGTSAVDSGTINDTVLGNSIFANNRLGIDLGSDGPTPGGGNSASFPNDGQNAPVLTSVFRNSVSGNLTTAPGSYRVELFASPTAGTLLQGQSLLGFTTVVVPAGGTQTFTLSGLTIPFSATVTATATNLANGDTSEFGTLPTTNYVVTTANDVAPFSTHAGVTLRDVITALSTGAASGNAPAPSLQNTLSFAIGRTGSVQTITLSAALGPLPLITREVDILGLSQGGTTVPYAGPPLIILNGAGAGTNASGLDFGLGSDGSVVTGLNIEHFKGNGIVLDLVQDVVVQGNYVGTDRTGKLKAGNGGNGVLIEDGATGNTIGGSTLASRNIISGNSANGVEIIGGGSSGNVVEGNYVGTDVSGTRALANASNGVLIVNGATGNRIGANGDGMTDTAERNLLSGNGNDGVEVFGFGSTGNVVAGNFIGTSVAGLTALHNYQAGVAIVGGASDNRVGAGALDTVPGDDLNLISGNLRGGVLLQDFGTTRNVVAGNYIGTSIRGTTALGNNAPGVIILNGAAGNQIGTDASGDDALTMRNVIWYNNPLVHYLPGVGVYVGGQGSVGNSILGNSIWANTKSGIYLASSTANNGQAAPVMTSMTASSISGSLTSKPGTYRIEIFACPRGPVPQGKTYIGCTMVTLTANGSQVFTATLTVPAGMSVTSTATNVATGDTSAFS